MGYKQKTIKKVYRVVRSVLFTAVLAIIALYVLLFILLSIPPVQEKVRDIAQRELSDFLKADVKIGRLIIYPFNEVIVKDVELYTPQHQRCATIEKLGAGISLWDLITERRIILTYAELLGLDANISQAEKDGPLNIDFIIKALEPKDKTKPPTKFDLELHSVVIRNCQATFDRLWMPRRTDGAIDFNHAAVSNLRADIDLPRLKNNDFIIDLRRLSFKTPEGLDVEKFAIKTHITDHSISVKDFTLQLPATQVSPADFTLEFDSFRDIPKALETADLHLVIVDNVITPSDFAPLLPRLAPLHYPFKINADISGNINAIEVNTFKISVPGQRLNLDIEGYASGLKNIKSANIDLDKLHINASSSLISDVAEVIGTLPEGVTKIISGIGDLSVKGEAGINAETGAGFASLDIDCSAGSMTANGNVRGLNSNVRHITADLDIPSMDVGAIIADSHVGSTSLSLKTNVTVGKGILDGTLESEINRIVINGMQINAINLNAMKNGKEIRGSLTSDDSSANLHAQADMTLDGKNSLLTTDVEIFSLIPSRFGLLPNYPGYNLSGYINADIAGNSLDNIIGDIDLHDIIFTDSNNTINLESLRFTSTINDELRYVTLRSDILDADISGIFTPSKVPSQVFAMLAKSMPELLDYKPEDNTEIPDINFAITLHPDTSLREILPLPIRPLDDVTVKGDISSVTSTAELDLYMPYLIQGKKSLIRNTEGHLIIDSEEETSTLSLGSLLPAKKGDAYLAARIQAHDNRLFTELGWKGKETNLYRGKISFDAQIRKNPLNKIPDMALDIIPSEFYINGEKWNVSDALIGYIDNVVTADGLKVWHNDQFVEIDGTASQSPDDVLQVELADIDLDFIFDTLDINHVSFGGTATGVVEGRQLLSGQPVAATQNLFVKNLAYNGAVLGDGNLKSSWDNELKKISIYADIHEGNTRRAIVDGGLFLNRDSLSFEFDANKVNIEFLQPFMSAFSSEVRGRASGKAKLYGNFSDIDLAGRLRADTLFIKLDQTNVTYSGGGSVIIDPGHIIIPSFRLYDRYGNSGLFSGELTHRCFHDPSFNFKLTDARNLLCYDTNETFNPVWYGTVFCNGNANIHGVPGLVSIDVDVSTASKSSFTFVLSDTQVAEDYTFLTFSDRRKEATTVVEEDPVPQAVRELFHNASVEENGIPTTIAMNLQVRATPQAQFNLIMDPASGDKIRARGSGPIKIAYDSYTDNMTMYGKYAIEEGTYNFTLQDLIIRDFSISQGSTLSFNGNPMNAMLDISAIYRVNTNLSDLDKSFSNDRDLNRTNVPVDACLFVKGDLDSPEISFDLKLPTLTSDVERKVKSIISTDDMMSRQILYLLALNRFYTPEYMGVTSNGTGELASVASSTISSQFSRLIGSLTDKVSLAPSFRSDRGDFSDFEMDLALSSRLLDNRLLLNGNFGYRDRSSSQTTFVGDFDIEYLLSRNGNLRLKAYNHFNDQNYYLKSSLTTQGIGIIYRHDFNNPFTFLKRKKRKESNDSIAR